MRGCKGLVAVGVLVGVIQAQAASRYVWTNSPTPAAPFTDWSTAAHTIQDAIDASSAGDTVWVTNGIYETGSRTNNMLFNGTALSRVVVDKAITVQSVNGPEFTIIKGYQVPGTTNGDLAVRCVSITTNGLLSGFTCTGGGTSTNVNLGSHGCNGGAINGNYLGGWYVGTRGVISNCILTGNSAWNAGAGAADVTVYNSVIVSNVASYGAGAYSCYAVNSYIALNTASGYGGGVYLGNSTLCTIVSNKANHGGGAFLGGTPLTGSANDCLIAYNTALLTGGGVRCSGGANDDDDTGSLRHCTVVSNVASVGGGCHSAEIDDSIVYGNTGTSESPNHTNCIMRNTLTEPYVFFAATDCFGGDPLFVDSAVGDYHLQAASPCIDRGPAGARLDESYTGATFNAVGAYDYIPVRRFVSTNGVNIPPYTNWTSAATSIQAALAVATPYDVITVAPGTYSGASSDGTNLLRVGDRILLQSLSNDAPYTILNGLGQFRGIFATGTARILGLTITNCVADGGAGIAGERLVIDLCDLRHNRATNGHGGGLNLVDSLVRNCIVADNLATSPVDNRDGGGIFSYGSQIHDCTVAGNVCGRNGSGIYQDQRANSPNVISNCIVYGNSGGNGEIVAANSGGTGLVVQTGTCSPSLIDGVSNNITADPVFVDAAGGNYHVQSHSPVIDRVPNNDGLQRPIPFDLDRTPRELDGDDDGESRMDMGAYEFTPAPPAGGASYHYVSKGGNGTAPYTSWATASASIQDVIDAAPSHGHVWVACDGNYDSPGRTENYIVIDKPLSLRGLSLGGLYPARPEIVNCGIHVQADDVLIDSLTLYAAPAAGIETVAANTSISNCLIYGAHDVGIHGGAVFDSVISSGTSRGCEDATLYQSAVYGNKLGGISNCTAWNTVISVNTGAPGVTDSTLYNCNVVENKTVPLDESAVRNSTLVNCIVYKNDRIAGGSFDHCVLFTNGTENPFPVYTDCFWADPLFVMYDISRVSSTSVCIDAGLALTGPQLDYFGTPRPLDGNGDGVAGWDIGVSECVVTNAMSDPDVDGLNNEEEAIAGSDPVDRNSRFRLAPQLASGGGGGFVFSWQSVTGRLYSVAYTTNLLTGWFSSPYVDRAGSGGVQSYTNSNESPHRYFSVRVRRP